VQFLPELAAPGMRQLLAATVGLLAVLTACAGLRRWRQVDRAIRCGEPLPRSAAPAYLVAGLMVIGMSTVALAGVSAGS
jgi:putative membrane protein